MTNNYVLRRLRYIFDYNDNKMISIFAQADLTVTREQISAWLKKDEDPAYIRCTDNQMAHFLNGFIIEKRGKKDGPQVPAEHRLNNNIIFRKLKIALNLIDDDIIKFIEDAGFLMSKHELSALFRKPDHRSYRECQDQILRNFIKGIQLNFHEANEETNKTGTNKPAVKTATPHVYHKPFEKKAPAKKVKFVNPALKKTIGFEWKPLDKK